MEVSGLFILIRLESLDSGIMIQNKLELGLSWAKLRSNCFSVYVWRMVGWWFYGDNKDGNWAAVGFALLQNKINCDIFLS